MALTIRLPVRFEKLLPCVMVCLFFLFPATKSLACDQASPCTVQDGFYLMRTPKGWDGKTPLPAAVFFHGYSASADEVMKDVELGRTLSDLGVLLVAPNGNDHSWSFPGKMQGSRDDFAFVGHVLDDVEKRLPIDRSRLWATGFSIGGSMTWYLSCFMPERFAAFAPVAGAFWDPMPQISPPTCPGGPVALRHIHGLADKTVPMAGRPIRGGVYHQGDVMKSIAHLKARNGCPQEPTSTSVKDGLTCQTWAGGTCTSGKEIVLCLHKGEHEIAANWIGDDYRWVEGLAGKHAGLKTP